MELTREFLNSCCDTDWVIRIVGRVVDMIKTNIFKNYKTQKKIVWDIGVEQDTNTYYYELLRRQQSEEPRELSWKFALEMVVAELKKYLLIPAYFIKIKKYLIYTIK